MKSHSILRFKESLSDNSKHTFNDGSIKKTYEYYSQMGNSNSKEFFKKTNDLEQYSKVVDYQETDKKSEIE